MSKDRQPTSARDDGNITLDTDEIGIWLIYETPEGPQQMGLVTWNTVIGETEANIKDVLFSNADKDEIFFDWEKY